MDRSISRALLVLERLARDGGPVRMSRLAAEVNLQKSTVHRLLKTLVELGYVEQEEEAGRYRPSLKLWELGSAVVIEHPVKRTAASFLQNLHRETGETVSLLVPSGDDVLYLDKIISPRAIRYSTRPGSRVPAPLTAGGQAMLAHDPDAREVVERVAQKLVGRRSFDPDAMIRSLEEARARGYSISRANPGVISMGCPLMARTGRAAAAISISAPTEKLDQADEDRMAEALLSTCARLTELVGHF